MALTTIYNSLSHYYKLYSTYILVIKSQNYNTGHRHNSWSSLKMSLRYSSWKLTLRSEKLILWEAVLCRVFPSNIWQCLLCFEGIPLKSPFIANAFTRTIGRTVKNRQPPFLRNKGPSWTWRWLFFNFPLKSTARLKSSDCYFTISLHITLKKLFHCLDSSSLSGAGQEPETL